jgi:hypothetical protein
MIKVFGALFSLFALAAGGYLVYQLFISPGDFIASLPRYFFIAAMALIAMVAGIYMLREN